MIKNDELDALLEQDIDQAREAYLQVVRKSSDALGHPGLVKGIKECLVKLGNQANLLARVADRLREGDEVFEKDVVEALLRGSSNTQGEFIYRARIYVEAAAKNHGDLFTKYDETDMKLWKVEKEVAKHKATIKAMTQAAKKKKVAKKKKGRKP